MTYERECVVCGKTFVTGDSRKIMCSRYCQKLRTKDLNETIIDELCPVCGTYFSKKRTSKRKTCSEECAVTLRANSVRETKKKKKNSLEKLVSEASEKGISYGQLQAQRLLAEMRAAE